MGKGTSTATTAAALEDRARDLDAADPLARVPRPLRRHRRTRRRRLPRRQLARPPAARRARDRLDRFVREEWGGRLIRGWDEGWMDLPAGDRRPARPRRRSAPRPARSSSRDSTTVMLYKLARAAVAARPGRSEIVLDTDNFPTDRYVLEGIAAERGLDAALDRDGPGRGRHAASRSRPRSARATALVVLSHVAYRSALPRRRRPRSPGIAHDGRRARALGPCHSAGSVEIALDDWGVDLAVGLHLQVPQRRARARPRSATSAPRTRTSCSSRSGAGSGGATRSRWARATSPPPASAASSAARRRSLGMLAAAGRASTSSRRRGSARSGRSRWR